MTCLIESAHIKGCFSIFHIFREERLFEVHTIDTLSWSRSEESLYHTEADRVYEYDELIVGTFFVDDEWIFLGVSLECYFFTQVCHAVDMVHPEFIDGSERKSSFELCKFFFCTSIAEFFYATRKKRKKLIFYLIVILTSSELIHIDHITSRKLIHLCDDSTLFF